MTAASSMKRGITEQNVTAIDYQTVIFEEQVTHLRAPHRAPGSVQSR
jgi:hypothetical protein